MKIRILAIGKLKEKYWKDAVAEYEKRLGPYTKLEILEGPEVNAPADIGEKERLRLLKKEGFFFSSKIREDDCNIALDMKGTMITSEDLADIIREQGLMKGKTINFLIGGSLGMDPEIIKKCRCSVAFGRATFPHQMIRVFLTEQIYRGFKIIRGEPYHK